MRFTFLSLIALAGCSLATDFDRFHADDQKGNVGDGGDQQNGDGDGDGDSMNGDGDTDLDSGKPKVEGQIDVVLEEGALGTVTSSPGGIDCGDTCSAVYEVGTDVILTATPDPTAAFVGWGGDCQGQSGFTCKLKAGKPLTATAAFTSDWYQVTVLRLGDATGAVASADQMVRCDGAADEVCVVRYKRGTDVTLTATPTAGGDSTFSGWGGSCSGSGACGLNMSGDKIVNAVFDAAGQVSLIVSKEGNGEGTVGTEDGTTEKPASINCGSDCAASYAVTAAAVVTLKATADGSSNFDSFTGCASQPTPTQCSVTMNAVKQVKARFNLKKRALDVAWAGQGAGSVVTLEPEALPECVKPNACPTGNYDHGTKVKLEAKPAEGSTFKQWSVTACGTNPVCEIPLMADTLVVASFDIQSYAFTPGMVGPAGSVNNLLCTVDDAMGEPQTNACIATTYAHGTPVTVTAAPSANNELASWGQACAGKAVDQPCSLVITGATNVLATFQKKKFPVKLSFNSIEGGSGSVTGGLTCSSGGAECTKLVEYGSDLTIDAVAGPNSNFDGFIGCGAATTPCELDDIDGPRNVTVTFKSATSTLNTLFVNKVNGEGGTVTSSGGQINCGASCSAGFAANSTVNLTVTPAANYDFTAFSGGTCALNQGTCSVTMDADGKQFSATFTPKNYPVVVAANTGNGVGRVTGSIEGIADKIDCGQGATDCSANLPYGRTLILTAQPQVPPAGHSEELVTWGGVCANAVGNTCQIVVGAGTNQVAANFSLRKYLLSIQLHGDGAAGNDPLVTGNGLACTFKGQGTSECQVLLTALTQISLSAKSPRWAQFKGFGGACSGTSCSFALSSNKPVDATFESSGALAFVTAEPRSGMIDDPKLIIPRGARAGDDICQNLADAQGLPGKWKAWLSDGNSGPAKRLQNLSSSTPIVALNGDVVMKGGWGSIGDVKMSRSLSVTETGDLLDPRGSFIPVWTATSPKGEPIGEDAAFCGSAGAPPREPARFWSSKDSSLTIRYGVGNALATDGAWTFNPNGFGGGILIPFAPPPGIPCDTQARLYCFQDVIWPAPAPQ